MTRRTPRSRLQRWTIGSFAERLRADEGIALITAMLVVFVVTTLAVVMVMNLNSDLEGSKRSKEVTSARSAADAGIDQLLFKLQQSTNWTSFQTDYNSSGNWYGVETSGANAGWTLIGRGRYRAHIDPMSDPSSAGDVLVTVEGQYPADGGEVRTLQAVIRKQAPAGLSFAMLADKGIDIHHHGGSWVSPTLKTTQIHSNGYIKLQYSSAYRVKQISAATTVTIGSGGGSTPGGGIPAGGYRWAYNISGTDTANAPRCYPPKIFPPKTVSKATAAETTLFNETWNVPVAGSCDGIAGQTNYSKNAQVAGDVFANQVVVESNGDTVSSTSGGAVCTGTTTPGVNDPVTGACIPDKAGDIHAGKVTVNGTSYSGVAAGTSNQINTVNCPNCSQGTADQGGHVGGVLKLHPQDFTPGKIEFPSLNYASVYRPLAKIDQGNAETCANKTTKICHIFPTSDSVNFLNYIATKENVTDKDYNLANCPAKNCLFWKEANGNKTTDPKKVGYVIAQGHHYLNASLSLDQGAIRSIFQTEASRPAPVIMIQGSLVVPTGNINIASSITVVGKDMDPFNPTATYASNTVPGLLAAGKGFHSSDYDTDSGWTSTSQYEPLKRNAATVRGLVYSATWSTTTNKSLATDQHWHNYDAKNSTTIIGAQVGGSLHDCNSFVFAYDPLVANLPGFTTGSGTGTAYIVDWREI